MRVGLADEGEAIAEGPDALRFAEDAGGIRGAEWGDGARGEVTGRGERRRALDAEEDELALEGGGHAGGERGALAAGAADAELAAPYFLDLEASRGGADDQLAAREANAAEGARAFVDPGALADELGAELVALGVPAAEDVVAGLFEEGDVTKAAGLGGGPREEEGRDARGGAGEGGGERLLDRDGFRVGHGRQGYYASRDADVPAKGAIELAGSAPGPLADHAAATRGLLRSRGCRCNFRSGRGRRRGDRSCSRPGGTHTADIRMGSWGAECRTDRSPNRGRSGRSGSTRLGSDRSFHSPSLASLTSTRSFFRVLRLSSHSSSAFLSVG